MQRGSTSTYRCTDVKTFSTTQLDLFVDFDATSCREGVILSCASSSSLSQGNCKNETVNLTRSKGNGDGRSPMYPLLYNATNNRQSRVKRIIIIGSYPVYVSVVRRYVVMTCPYCPNKSPVVYMTGYPA